MVVPRVSFLNTLLMDAFLKTHIIHYFIREDLPNHLYQSWIPLSMNVSTFLAYDQPTISYCGVHHELLSHKSFETNAQEDTMETHLETELDLSTITAAARITDHKQPLA
ncbi:hypothetical protein M91_21329 [Bos mutus]|uniref:Uncharacterized protein n=1 Tax=Bos mutus TaxID=72004 RepID=L8IW65_9CETA|nr:hypothetical protein M91_21329 [Bos mutus]